MSQSVIYQYLTAGSFDVTVPSGYSNQVLVYAWGGGGGTGYNGPLGGGGGYAAGVVNINAGDSVTISVGGHGARGPYNGSAAGGDGNDSIISFDGGGGGTSSPYPGGDDQYIGAGGGGGAASAIFVNSVPLLVAAGGGGGGGGSNYQTGAAGLAGGIATAVNSTARGATSVANYATGGGGGGGYPKGGAAGTSVGDDAGGPGGGYGGQNYANVTVTSATLTAGSGTNTAGTGNGYYPGKNLGKAGYDGCVIVVFQKLFTVSIKQSGLWKQVTNAYIKVPTTSYTTYSSPAGSATYTSPGTHTFTVPAGVTSLNTTIVGGSGGGGGGGSSAGQTGGTSYQDLRTITVTPGETITIKVGAGGQGGRSGIPNCGSDGVTWFAVDGDVAQRRGQGGTGYASGGAGDGAGCIYSFNATGGWAGGGGGSSALTYSSGTIIAGGGSGGAGGNRPEGYSGGTGGSGGNSGTGNQGVIGVPGGAGQGATTGGGYGTDGLGGRVIISYAAIPIATASFTGGWKQIVRGWLKEDGVWQNIATPLTLTSSKVSGAPSRRAVISLVIATNTSSYNLLDTLNTLGTYYPGYSDITLTINVGVTINSNDSGGAALTIDGLTSGDSLIIVNNGTILGRGGYGGAAGYVSRVTVGSGKNSTTTNSPQPGGYGGAGGTALAVTYATTLQNNGVIYAGGGGGGGGGVSFNGTGGGQGGGGAGYGPGANAGTLTAGGAGGSNGGAGGSNGANGTAGTTGASYTYSTNNKGGVTSVAGSAGGTGGIGGKAITGYAKVTVTVAGTIVGPTA